MKLGQTSIAFIVAFFIALAFNAWMLLGIQEQQQTMEKVMHNRILSTELTAQIEKDTHQLSQFVRAYTSTGDQQYLEFYNDLLAIRKGIIAEPNDYSPQYWYEVLAGKREHFVDKGQVGNNSLAQKLMNLNFTAEEMLSLESILDISEKMTRTDRIAFAAMQGCYDIEHHHFVDHTDPNPSFAMLLINSPEYIQLNNDLLFQIESLTSQTDRRTSQQVENAQNQVKSAILYARSALMFSALLLIGLGYIIIKRILIPIKRLLNASNLLEHHQYETRADVGKSVLELKSLARNFNEMAANIEADIMHRSIIEQALIEEKTKLEFVNTQMQDSICSAALIQQALTPKPEVIDAFFREQMHIWLPKDVVGGDIYLFTTLRHEEESLLMVIDCTGHGVSGAFLTMLIKAIHQQIITNLKHRHGEISPAKILSEFNLTLKKLLKQDEVKLGEHGYYHDVGFDGAILYCDKQRNLVRFAGANTPLFFLMGNEVSMINGDRHSIGYSRSRADFVFTDHDLIATPLTTFYITTDGYLDQNGGKKQYPFGKKQFINLISESSNHSLLEQKFIFVRAMRVYQGAVNQTDDVTLFAFKL